MLAESQVQVIKFDQLVNYYLVILYDFVYVLESISLAVNAANAGGFSSRTIQGSAMGLTVTHTGEDHAMLPSVWPGIEMLQVTVTVERGKTFVPGRMHSCL